MNEGSKYLLDTCAFLWLVNSVEGKFSEKLLNLFQNNQNELYVSIFSQMEVAIKKSVGKIKLEYETEKYFGEIMELYNIDLLDFKQGDIAIMEKLPFCHKDPFDRIIIAQAINNGMTIISGDEIFKEYPVKCIW